MALRFSDLQNRIPSNFLNYGYDSIVGDNVAGGTSYPLYASLLGVEIELDNVSAAALSYSSTGTLYAGLYRYLQFLTHGTTAPTRGAAVFWDTPYLNVTLSAETAATAYVVTLNVANKLAIGNKINVITLTNGALSGLNGTGPWTLTGASATQITFVDTTHIGLVASSADSGSIQIVTGTGNGASLFATDGSQYVVNLDPGAATGDGLFAGVTLVTSATAAGTTTATGNFGWFQAEGICSCLFGGTADTTIGDLVVLNTGAATFQSLADTAATFQAGGQTNALKNIVGVAVEAPAVSVLKRVSIWPRNLLY